MRLQVLALCSVVLSVSACSDDATPNPGTGGAASGGSGGAGGSGGKAGGGTPGVGGSSAGAPSGGKAGSTSGGTGGTGGTGGGTGGTGGVGGSGGAKPDAEATITLMDLPTGDGVVAGTVHFAQTGAKVTMTFTVTGGCSAGDHAMHFHMNNVCGADGAAAGSHWVPQGEFAGKVTCDAAGKGTFMYSPPVDGTWTIGGPATSDILMHAMVLHEADEPNPSGRIACGVPVKKP